MRLGFWENPPDRKKALFLMLYIAGITILFLFLRFPGEAVRGFVEENSRRLSPELAVAVQDAGLSPLLWVVLKDVTFSYQGDVVARADKFKARPSISNLWGRRAGVFSSRIFGGVVRGRLAKGGTQGGSKAGPKDGLALEARFSGIRMDELPLKDYLPDYTLAGKLAGSLLWGSVDAKSPGQADLVVEEGGIVFTEPVFGLDRIDFDRLEASLTLSAGRVVIEKFEVKGPQVAGTLSGEIMLRHPYENSVLKIKGAVTPQAALIAKLGETIPVDMFIKKTPGADGFPVTISGTIAAPRFSMK